MEYNKSTEIKSLKQKMLLHVCCANCMLHPVSILMPDYDITLYFYNPNIHPQVEYIKRLESVKKAAFSCQLELLVPPYEPSEFLKLASGLKNEPEGGERCRICFDLRLSRTARYARENDFDLFATTLTVSPHKNQLIINSTGYSLSTKYGIGFYAADFKKKDGFKKTMQLSSEMGTYRQDYCGCIYSIKKHEKY